MAMYRAALEQLLSEQRFKEYRLSSKIAALRKEKDGNSPRPWVVGVDDVALDLLKKLADGALHTDGGGISRQDALDSELLADVELVFAALLHSVYEASAAYDAARLRMEQAVRRIKGREATSAEGEGPTAV